MGEWSKPHICQCLSRLLTFRCNSTVTVTGHRRKTGEQFVQSVLGLAHHLSELGLCPGDIVAICAFNSDWYVEWLLAVTYVGGTIAPLNYRWSSEESELALKVINPVMIVTDDSCMWSELCNNTMLSPRWHVSVNFYAPRSNSSRHGTGKCEPLLIKYCWAPEDAAVICFTSGTTGRPKGVTISHTSLMMQSMAKIAIVGYAENDVFLHTAPLCHIGGISSCMAILMAGGCHVFIPKFIAEVAVKAILENEVTSLIAVPTILADMICEIRHRQPLKHIETLKKILNGGGSLSAQLIEDAVKCFPKAKLLSAYGMTETCSSLTFMTLHDPLEKYSDHHFEITDKRGHRSVYPVGGTCVGKPAPHVELLVSKDDSPEIGRILTRGPHVMIRYWDQNATVVPSSSEDWFDTGDIGQFDYLGNLWLVGRKKDRIKSGGENVYPEEVETILSSHPGISSVVVIGLANARLGEMVVACVQLSGNWKWKADPDPDAGESESSMKMHLSEQMLKDYCRQKSLSGFKIPKAFIVWRKPFPLTSTGKIKRNEIKAKAMMQRQPSPSKL